MAVIPSPCSTAGSLALERNGRVAASRVAPHSSVSSWSCAKHIMEPWSRVRATFYKTGELMASAAACLDIFDLKSFAEWSDN
jgi:hypothetical protein